MIEESNLPRIPYANRSHVGIPKVAVAALFAGQKSPSTPLYAFPCKFDEQAVQKRFKKVNVLFYCGDNDGGRKQANSFCVSNGIPLIDLGCDVQVSEPNAETTADMSDGHTLARVSPSRRRTYGWRGSTILAALFNALILLVAIGGIVREAARRFTSPVTELPGMTIVVVAAVGVVINTAAAMLFLRGRKHDLNLRGVFLHTAADAGVSGGVVVAGLGVYYFGWAWIDPVTGLAIAAVIFAATWGLFKESMNLAIQAVPEHIDPGDVASYLAGLEGVAEVHDLHIWSISTTETALTVHLVKPQVTNEDDFLHRLKEQLHERFDIAHITVQIERGGGPACEQAPHDRV